RFVSSLVRRSLAHTAIRFLFAAASKDRFFVCRNSLGPLKGHSNALANTHAETYQGAGLSLPTQSIGRGHCQTRTAGAKRMPKRDRAAVAVDMLGIVGQSKTTRTREHLSGEGFIDFDAVELVEAPPNLG